MLHLLGLTGYHSCQMCMSNGCPNKPPKNEKKFGGNVVWPPSTMAAEPRTSMQWEIDAQQSVATNKIVNGIRGRSALLDLVDDIIDQVPIDAFHNVYLGMARRYYRHLFQLNKDNQPSSDLVPLRDIISDRYCKIRATSEFQRRPNRIDFVYYTACEWKNLIMVGVTVTYEALVEKGMLNIARSFLYFAFIVRVLDMGEQEYVEISREHNLRAIMHQFYSYYRQVLKSTIN